MWLELTLIGIVSFLIYQFLKPTKDFWKKYGVRQINNSSLLDKLQIFIGGKTVADYDDIAYEQLGSGKFCGLVEMTQPILLVKDMEVIKKILIKDFDHFVDRRGFVGSEKQKIINRMVGNLSGDEWKGVRSSLSPTFTSGKIRRMMEHFNNVAYEWTEHLQDEIKKSPQNKFAANINKETTSFTVDAIGAAVFGLSAGTIRNPESRFAKMVNKLSDFTILEIISFGLSMNFPKVIKWFGLSIMDDEALSFFEDLLSQGLKSRMEGKVKQNDFMQLLVEARKGELKSDGSDELSAFEKEAQLKNDNTKKNYLDDDLTTTAQALGFFFAGFSTTSNFLGFVMYTLALHQDVQNKLREEVNSKLFSKGDGKNIDYDELNRLPYLEMVFCEVLRKYPALGRLERNCVKDYHDPSENLRVPKGAMVAIPVQSIHHDKQHYEYPDKFYPEHFSPENKAKRSPYAYLPFGSGPRNCIGMRFALIEGKAGIAHLVHRVIIEPTAKTPIPVQVRPVGIGFQIPHNLELGLRMAN